MKSGCALKKIGVATYIARLIFFSEKMLLASGQCTTWVAMHQSEKGFNPK